MSCMPISTSAIRCPHFPLSCIADPIAEKIKGLWEKIKTTLGGWIRDFFFFPLARNLPASLLQEKEGLYVKQFFSAEGPLDPNFPAQEEIRKTFSLEEKEISLSIEGNKKISLTYRVLEPKTTDSLSNYNFVLLLGNRFTVHNNATGIYPYLSSYLDLKRENPSLPSGRFFLVSQYNLSHEGKPYRPSSLQEAGLILTLALASLKKEYGDIHQCVGHSLGCILLASALSHLVHQPDLTPKNLFFDRGPSSIKEISHSEHIGKLLFPLIQALGWSIDVGKEIYNFMQSLSRQGVRIPHVVIGGVEHDHYFSQQKNLYHSKEIESLHKEKKVERLLFDPPKQVFHERAHHNLGTHYLHPCYLQDGSSPAFMRQGESLSHALLRHSVR